MDLRRDRENVLQQMQDMHDVTVVENRDFSRSEQRQYDSLDARVDELSRLIEREERLGITLAKAPAILQRDGYSSEIRSLLLGSGPDGGYATTSTQYYDQVMTAIADDYPVYKLATKIPVPNAQALQVGAVDTNAGLATAVSETGTVVADSTLQFGARELNPVLFAKLFKVSWTLYNVAPNIDQILRDQFVRSFGGAIEQAAMVGTGANGPLGMFVASDAGIPTTRDVSTDNAATAVSGDGLIGALHALKPQYRRNACWFMHDDLVKMIRKLKVASTTGGNDLEYIWQPGLQAGQPDLLLGRPVYTSPYAPNTFTSGLYVAVLCDPSYYWFATGNDMTIQVLKEAYAESNQIGMIGRMRIDGQPMLAEAFVRVKLG